MKKIYYLFLLFVSIASLKAQVTITTNMPKNVAQNADVLVEIKINKGTISNFAKYQIDVPAGVTVTEGDSKTGNFTFDANRAKIVWVSIPTEPEFIVTMKFNTGALSGANVFNHKFYYLDNGVKKEVEGEAINVEFGGSGSSVASNKTETKTEPAKETKTETKSVPTETKVAVTETKTEPAKETKTETKSVPTETKVAANETKTEPVKETKAEPEVKVTKTEAKTTSASGVVYKIQLGAYGADPGQAKFAAIGKVTMSSEGGFIKALWGNFSTKEEALKAREELIAKGFTGFVVAYQNGVRVK